MSSVEPGGGGHERADLVVVGAGIVGLAHALHAARAGLKAVVLERDEVAVGASVRNFGHVCTTPQAGRTLEYALAAREDWLALGRAGVVDVAEHGTVVVARTEAERAVLEQFAAERGDAARLLTAAEAADRSGFAAPGTVAAAHLPMDLRIDPRTAPAAIAAHLVEQGVDIRFRTAVVGVEPGLVRTTRGDLAADRVIVAVGHDVDRFFPDLADAIGLVRCRLRMLEVDPPRGARVRPAVLTGLSMLRYAGFAAQPAADAVRDEVRASDPALLDHVVNLMLTQRPDGLLVLGDTHHYAVTEPPFEDEASDELLLTQFRRLLDVDHLVVRRRWRGVYASSPATDFLLAEPLPGVTVVSVTTGVGMTTAFGFARAVLDGGAAALVRHPRVPEPA